MRIIYPPGRRITVRWRLLGYGAVWLLAALAIQLFLRPEGLTETNLNEAQQRALWLLYTPVMATIGLADALQRVSRLADWSPLVIAICFALHALVILTQSRPRFFAIMIFVQIVLLSLAIMSFIHLSRLPAGP